MSHIVLHLLSKSSDKVWMGKYKCLKQWLWPCFSCKKDIYLATLEKSLLHNRLLGQKKNYESCFRSLFLDTEYSMAICGKKPNNTTDLSLSQMAHKTLVTNGHLVQNWCRNAIQVQPQQHCCMLRLVLLHINNHIHSFMHAYTYTYHTCL
jgi:hypothetical protein